MPYSSPRDKNFGHPGELCVVRSLCALNLVVQHTSMEMGADGKDYDFKFWSSALAHAQHPEKFMTGEVKTQDRYSDTGNLWVLWKNRPGGQRHTIDTCVATYMFIVCCDGIFGFRPGQLADALHKAVAAGCPDVWFWENLEGETLAFFTGQWFQKTVKPSSVPVVGTNPTQRRRLYQINRGGRPRSM